MPAFCERRLLRYRQYATFSRLTVNLSCQSWGLLTTTPFSSSSRGRAICPTLVHCVSIRLTAAVLASLTSTCPIQSTILLETAKIKTRTEICWLSHPQSRLKKTNSPHKTPTTYQVTILSRPNQTDPTWTEQLKERSSSPHYQLSVN